MTMTCDWLLWGEGLAKITTRSEHSDDPQEIYGDYEYEYEYE